ncbi:MAG: asparagine synthase (glutamine-hydrolyzing) [Phycisphaerales bacterium]
MCGIAGILKIHDPKDGPPPPHLDAIPEAWLGVLDESIKHRGPDGQGRFRDRAVRADGVVVDVAFVHRRLSIIDHAGGHQPMVHDGECLRPDLTYARGETPKLAHELCPASERPDLVAVVFNGCIYNHRELRAELESLGHRFETDHSDTEVLVHGWRAWENGLLCRVDAMAAIAVWDRNLGSLARSRDRCGEKPLYTATVPWAPWGSTQSFTSSYPGVARSLVLAAPPDEHPLTIAGKAGALDGWVSDGTDSIPPVEPTEELFTGHIDSRIGTIGQQRYWERPNARTGEAPLFEDLLERAVRSRLESDVPLGVFLSGGIDSALIAAIAKKSRPDIETFTVRMPDARYDESDAAAETAKAIGVLHTILECHPEPAADLVRLIEQLGLPFGDSSLLPTYWVSKAARQRVKVALSGDGGDELFGGYRRHTVAPVLNRWHPLLRLLPDRLLDQRRPGGRSTYLARLIQAARFGGYGELLAIFPTPDLRRLVPTIEGEPTGEDRFRRVDDPLRHDFERYLPDDLLRKTDTASMAVALEVRAPFLARELVEAALRTPLDVLMPNGERKGLLKQVARKYLPDDIVDRPKRGFAIPVGAWFRTDHGGMRTLLYDHLESTDPFPGLADAGVEINMTFVRKMLREHDAAGEQSINPWHGRDHSQRLYMLLVLSIWAKWLAGVRAKDEPRP